MKTKIKIILALILILTLTGACAKTPGEATLSPAESSPTQSALAPIITERPGETANAKNTAYTPEDAHIVLNPETGYGYSDNVIVVIAKKNVGKDDIIKLFPNEKAEIIGSFPGLNQYQVKIEPKPEEKLNAICKELMKNPDILFAHLDLAASLGQGSENSKKQSTSDKTEKPDLTNEWWYAAAGLDKILKNEPIKDYVKVAVIDDGFDDKHPDLKLAFLSEEQKEQNSPADHGTHVAGIISQIMPNATIYVNDSKSGALFTENGSFSQISFLKNLADMAENDIKVLNYSMGTVNSSEEQMKWTRQYSAINSVYIYLLKQAGRDFIVVQSAGNVGTDAETNGVFCAITEDTCLGSQAVRESLGVSADIKKAQKQVFDSLMIVGACSPKTPEGQYIILSGTNYGSVISVMAPGEDIKSTATGGTYMLMSGTSQAAPIVSGALGLLWSYNKNLTSGELKDAVLKTATEKVFGGDSASNQGAPEYYKLINIYAAFSALQK